MKKRNSLKGAGVVVGVGERKGGGEGACCVKTRKISHEEEARPGRTKKQNEDKNKKEKMLKRRDWLHLHGEDGSGTSSGSSGRSSTSGSRSSSEEGKGEGRGEGRRGVRTATG